MSVRQPACIFVCEGELERALFAADCLHYKMKEKPHTELKVERGMVSFFLFLKGNSRLMWKPPWRRKTWSNQPTGTNRTYGVCAQIGSVCVCLVSKFELGSSWSSYASLGVCVCVNVSLPAWQCASLFVCLNARVFMYCFERMPLCTCVLFVWVGGFRFIGWAHLRSQAVVDSKVISPSSESLPVPAFHLLCQATYSNTIQVSFPLSLCLNPILLHLCLNSLSSVLKRFILTSPQMISKSFNMIQ